VPSPNNTLQHNMCTMTHTLQHGLSAMIHWHPRTRSCCSVQDSRTAMHTAITPRTAIHTATRYVFNDSRTAIHTAITPRTAMHTATQSRQILIAVCKTHALQCTLQCTRQSHTATRYVFNDLRTATQCVCHMSHTATRCVCHDSRTAIQRVS